MPSPGQLCPAATARQRHRRRSHRACDNRAPMEPLDPAAAAVSYYARRETATGHSATTMVVATSGRAAAHAARAVLDDGGSAVDAVATAALAQTALSAGCWDSYAGILSLVCFDAGTRSTHSLNAAFNTVLAERRPRTITKRGTSGRAVLVPGFMAGIQAMHERFGRVPFTRLFDPAIAVAEAGFELGPILHALMAYRQRTLARTPEGREIFLTPHGQLLEAGDTFRQPQLASTLRRVAAEGADHMYRGEWARRFVGAVQARRGALALRDLERYRVSWDTPLGARYGGYEIAAPALPSLGGAHLVEAVHLLECAKLPHNVHYSQSPEALYWLIQIARAARLGPALPVALRLRDETAQRLWAAMQRHGGITYASRARMQKSLAHTDAVVAVDRYGNVAVLCHSINTMAWGSTGLFVGGVSIPDSASFQQAEIAQAGPGQRLPDLMNPLLLMREAKPAIGAACIGSSLHETMLQFLVNAIDYGLSIERAAEAPLFLVSNPGRLDRLCAQSSRLVSWAPCLLRRLLISTAMLTGRPRRALSPAQAIEHGVFPEDVLSSLATRGQRVAPQMGPELLGYLAALAFDDRGTGVHGVVTMMPSTDGSVVGD